MPVSFQTNLLGLAARTQRVLGMDRKLLSSSERQGSKKGREDTANEKKLAKTMRDAWAGFAKDPIHGLPKLGWPVYDSSKPSVVVIGGKDSADIKYELPSSVDPVCVTA